MIEAKLIKPGTVLSQMPNDESVPNPVPLVFGTLYTFHRAGAKIPMHTHTDNKDHFTYIGAGSFKVTRGGIVTNAQAGDMLLCEANSPHEIECVQPGQVLNGVLSKIGSA